ncbi:MAG TPA: ethylbenzene dehydrogenase-related protein, partial [candidate division Zixibacteria bacterium]|nr:ethylbenzene dehydrogenase-related protein [candidate division Zixibacteria bacterium]
LFTPDKGNLSFFRALAQFAFIFSSSLVVLSGMSLYCGWYHTPGSYGVLVNIHRIAGIILVGSTVLAIPYLVLRKRNSFADAGSGLNAAVSSVLFVLIVSAALFAGSRQSLYALHSFARERGAVIDGIASDSEWRGIPEVTVPCTGGANFPHSVSWVKVKSFHNRQFMYFLFQWADRTRSANRNIEKTASGWSVMKSESNAAGECSYFEDQLAVSVSQNSSGCLGSCHLSSGGEIGSHFTKGDTVDLWVWRAQSTDPAGQADDGWWGGLPDDTGSGRHFDNSPAGGFISNLNPDWNQPYFIPDAPLLARWIDLRNNFMTPYFADEDTFRVGTVLTDVLVSPFMGDRGNVRASSHWEKGIWTVELARERVTGSPADLKLTDDVYLNIALFDNAELAHAFELKPIRLIMR